MKLYIVRHAIAEEATENKPDSQRQLTEKGHKKMERIARGLKQLAKRLDLILTSPHLRAAQTAEILRNQFKLDTAQVVETEHLTPMGFADQLIEEINRKYSEAGAIALVGHEPYLSQLASMLSSGGAGLSVDFKKGGVCRLSVPSGALQYGHCATLDWLFTPAQLVELGK